MLLATRSWLPAAADLPIPNWVEHPRSAATVWTTALGAWGGMGRKFALAQVPIAQASPSSVTTIYTAVSDDGIEFTPTANQSVSLYDPAAAGATYDGGSYVTAQWMAGRETAGGTGPRYIISFASAPGSISDQNMGLVPNLAATFNLISDDGLTWSRSSMPAGNWHRIRRLNGVWIALSFKWFYIPATVSAVADTKYAVSTDGVTWTVRNFPIPLADSDIAFDVATGTYIVSGVDYQKRGY